MKEREKICSPKTHERKRENLHIPAKEVLVYYHVLTPLYYWNSLTKNEELAYYTFNSYLMNMHHHPILCFHTFHLLPPTPTISFLYWPFALPRQGRKDIVVFRFIIYIYIEREYSSIVAYGILAPP